MFLIDQPYVSDFLIETIRDYHYPIIATSAARELVSDDSLNWISEATASAKLGTPPAPLLYTNSENGLSWVIEHIDNPSITKPIQVLKDKFKFRELISDLFPDFYFSSLSVEKIQDLKVADFSFPFVIKPSIGFFSIGVHIIKNERDWQVAKRELSIDKLQSIFPASVLDTSQFIIEEYLDGEEYAIDYYHNNEGEVVITNILHHLFSSGSDTSDRVYTTSKSIILENESRIKKCLQTIGDKLDLKRFPAHAEVRIDNKGRVVPIEINPLRTGGFCTTGDLLGVTLNFNAHHCYQEQQSPDWNEIFKGKTDKQFSIVILNNNSGIAAERVERFDYDLLAQGFENPLKIRRLDINKYPVFGFIFVETSNGNEKELYDILTSDLSKYIYLK